jgi:ATP-binding protein involved in chromosome partitioning
MRCGLPGLTRRGASRGAAADDLHDAVRKAVGCLAHPRLDRPLAELGLVEGVEVHAGGDVTISVRTLTPAGSSADPLLTLVEQAASRVDGIRRVEVREQMLEASGRAALAGRLRARNRRPGGLGSPTKVYAIASGKGGVGKSSLTANIAVALVRSGQRVGVLDADVWGYSIPQLFGIREQPLAVKGVMLPVEAHGVRLMSIGFFADDEQPVVWRGPMLQKALEQFLDDVCWGDLDVLLVDLPPGTGDVPLTVLELLPDAAMLVVTTPQRAAEQVASRVGRMALDARMPVAGVVENMSGAGFGAGGGDRLAQTLGAPLLGRVPMDERMCRAGDLGVPLLVGAPDAPSTRAVGAVAAALPAVRRTLVGRPLPLFVDRER